MQASLYESLVERPKSMIQQIPMSEWPMNVLDEFAYDIVPQGSALSVITNSVVKVENVENKTRLNHQPGIVAVDGFFRGYNNLGFKMQNDTGDTKVEDVLVLRLDDSKNNINLIPVDQITAIDRSSTLAESLLDQDDRVVQQINQVIKSDHVDLQELSRIFSSIDIHNLETTLYIEYLNTKLQLHKKLMALLVKGYLFVEDNRTVVQQLKTPELTSPDEGRSFSLVGLVYRGGKTENILCVNVMTPHDSYARVRPEDIVSEFYAT